MLNQNIRSITNGIFHHQENEREANLLYILQEVIKMPLGSEEQIKN